MAKLAGKYSLKTRKREIQRHVGHAKPAMAEHLAHQIFFLQDRPWRQEKRRDEKAFSRPSTVRTVEPWFLPAETIETDTLGPYFL